MSKKKAALLAANWCILAVKAESAPKLNPSSRKKTLWGILVRSPKPRQLRERSWGNPTTAAERRTAKSVGVNHAAKSNTHSQQGCAHTHLKPRWHMWKACKAQMGAGCLQGSYESRERWGKGGYEKRVQYGPESASAPCKSGMCLESQESSSLLSNSLRLSSHTRTL